MKHRFALIFGLLAVPFLINAAESPSEAEQCVPGEPTWPAYWQQPYAPHRVIGNLYAVGNAGLSVYLITTDEGHVLVNTGLADSTADIRAGIEAMGYAIEDVKILLTTQAHFDHTAALAEIKALTGASMMATVDDARVLEDGGQSDAHFGHCREFRFAPIAVDRRLRHGDTIEIGGLSIEVHEHPGHTEGSSSYTWRWQEGGRDYDVGIVNMGTINEGKRLLIDATYPGVAEDFATTFARQRQMQLDVWVSSHGSQYRLADKHREGQPYDVRTFVDPEGFHAAVDALQDTFLQTLTAELESGLP